MTSNYAPIIFFTYKRLTSAQKVIESLKNCFYAKESDLYIYSDGPKNSNEKVKVDQVRDYLKTVSGFKSVTLRFSDVNKGLANSIIQGVTEIFTEYETVVVLEDDLVVSPNFLAYMNAALLFYETNKKIFSISGYNIPMSTPSSYPWDVYFTFRSSSWGWASWKDRWQGIDWAVKDFESFKVNNIEKRRFNRGGSDLFHMLSKQKAGKVDSWAIRWCYHQYKIDAYCVYPVLSKIKNIGFDSTASNSNSYNRYDSKIDESVATQFRFADDLIFDADMMRQFNHFYSLRSRILGKIKTYLYKRGLIKNKL